MTRRFAWFVVVGGIGFIVDAGLTLLIGRAGGSYIVARIPAIMLAMLTTWLLNRRFTFSVREEKTVSEAVRYFAISLASAVMNFLLYSWLIGMGVWPFFAIALATGSLMIFSFVCYGKLAFKKS